jgi:uncharacterized protein (TIGR02246 family)
MDRAQSELEIMRLVQRYGIAADKMDREAFAQCFADDGVFNRLGTDHSGRASIAAAITCPPNTRRRHFFSPPVVCFSADDAATGHGSGTLVQHDDTAGTLKPLVVIDYQDTYRLTADGWKFAFRKMQSSF